MEDLRCKGKATPMLVVGVENRNAPLEDTQVGFAGSCWRGTGKHGGWGNTSHHCADSGDNAQGLHHDQKPQSTQHDQGKTVADTPPVTAEAWESPCTHSDRNEAAQAYHTDCMHCSHNLRDHTQYIPEKLP